MAGLLAAKGREGALPIGTTAAAMGVRVVCGPLFSAQAEERENDQDDNDQADDVDDAVHDVFPLRDWDESGIAPLTRRCVSL